MNINTVGMNINVNRLTLQQISLMDFRRFSRVHRVTGTNDASCNLKSAAARHS